MKLWGVLQIKAILHPCYTHAGFIKIKALPKDLKKNGVMN